MNLDDAQKKKITEWIAQGLKLSEIQTRIAADFGVKLTYMDVRFLVDDLKLTPKDPEPPKPAAASPLTLTQPAQESLKNVSEPMAGAGKTDVPVGNEVSVVVDSIALPGSVVSGKVTFSDGNSASWYIDQTGRLGLVPQTEGYRPPQADVQKFQAALQGELAKLGF
jgi:hypothetical protein